MTTRDQPHFCDCHHTHRKDGGVLFRQKGGGTYHFVHEDHVGTVPRKDPVDLAVLLAQIAEPLDKLQHEQMRGLATSQ